MAQKKKQIRRASGVESEEMAPVVSSTFNAPGANRSYSAEFNPDYSQTIKDLKRIAILDTDAHHGDGTRALVRNDPDVLHVCICSSNYESEDGAKVDIAAPGRSWFSSACWHSLP